MALIWVHPGKCTPSNIFDETTHHGFGDAIPAKPGPRRHIVAISIASFHKRGAFHP
jgi:hypothetical protein